MTPRPNPSAVNPLAVAPVTAEGWLWDIFCQVIDNFGDVGVCWRLSADLAARGHRVRLWLDDPTALPWMAPGAIEGQWPGISVRAWGDAQDANVPDALEPGQVWVESFGCALPEAFVAAQVGAHRIAGTKPPVWINLEYLSAEAFVERCHGLPSPVMAGPAQGWTKHFFYPGFTPRTGGLLREPGWVPPSQVADHVARRQWLQQHHIADRGEALVSLFCYATAPTERLLESLAAQAKPVHLLVTAGQAHQALKAERSRAPWATDHLRITYLPLVAQTDFDALLCICDLNFVRGEDSLVRALWAGRPFVWQIYPQDDGAHQAKLDAFLDALVAPTDVRAWHAQWNQRAPWNTALELPLRAMPAGGEPSTGDSAGTWQVWAQAARQQLVGQTDLVSQLCTFVQGAAVAELHQKTR